MPIEEFLKKKLLSTFEMLRSRLDVEKSTLATRLSSFIPFFIFFTPVFFLHSINPLLIFVLLFISVLCFCLASLLTGKDKMAKKIVFWLKKVLAPARLCSKQSRARPKLVVVFFSFIPSLPLSPPKTRLAA
jgi:dolichyl-phosphate-mannose--protein O-mannosyl transferase